LVPPKLAAIIPGGCFQLKINMMMETEKELTNVATKAVSRDVSVLDVSIFEDDSQRASRLERQARIACAKNEQLREQMHELGITVQKVIADSSQQCESLQREKQEYEP
jgi:hypothetical protein